MRVRDLEYYRYEKKGDDYDCDDFIIKGPSGCVPTNLRRYLVKTARSCIDEYRVDSLSYQTKAECDK
eukprot:5924351-Pyramimonas_sp.AAC.1